jgi:hypothetical protein
MEEIGLTFDQAAMRTFPYLENSVPLVTATFHTPWLLEAAFIQSLGNDMVAKRPDGSAAAQLAGWAPENIFSTADTPMVLST